MAARCSPRGAPGAAVDSQSDAPGDVRFPRAYRLTRRADFNHVLNHATVRVTSGPFRAFAAASAVGPRIGMIVGKRQLPRAVDRNRVKRHIRESFRHARAALPAVDIVVRLVRDPGAEDARAALERLWAQIGERTPQLTPVAS